MNIAASAQESPALILLKSTLQGVTVPSPTTIQLPSDTVTISTAAKQLAQAISTDQL
jgi:hypothetical protein